MYNQTAQVSSHGKNIRFSGGQSGRRGKGKSTNRQERVRLLQLLVCMALFLTVFVGKGVFPTKLIQVRNNILSLISADTDFQAAFSNLGESLSGDGTVFGELGDFCVEVFGMGTATQSDLPATPVPQLTGLLESESKFLNGSPDQRTLAQHFFTQADTDILFRQNDSENPEQPEETQPKELPTAVAAVGTVLIKSDYAGQALPSKYTMDHLSLGALETVTPVMGHINSVYGYRDHPINGVYQFHGGLDIGGQTGDPIKSFAAGTVDYIGEDASYGLYLQIDHGDGIKSFYAHCESICVSKGQSVAVGEKIGAVGSSGAATGPHLHLELKCDGIHLDPIYYIEYMQNQ